MGNYWLDLYQLQDTAEKLEDFLAKNVRGKKYYDPKTEVKDLVVFFFNKYPEFRKFETRLDVQVKVVKNTEGSFSISALIVNCH